MQNLCKEGNPNVSVIFTTKSGVNIYALTDIMSISAERGLAAEKARRHAEFNISKGEFTKLIQAAKDAVNIERDFVKCMSIIHEMEYRNNFICEENSLLDLAYIYFMLEGEDVEVPKEAFNIKKKELMEGDMLLRSFFLQSALALTKRFSKQQEKDLLSYLEEMKVLSQRLQRFTQ